jgi:type II restriction enzyme
MIPEMNLILPIVPSERYKSASQIARVQTEQWAASNLYYSSCESEEVKGTLANTRAIDFTCPECDHSFQLKSSRKLNEAKVVDAGYKAMVAAIRSDIRPSLFVLHYTPNQNVENLLLVPRIFLTESAIQKRKPLDEHARRAGWVGCNILLSEIPTDGKIWLIRDGKETNRSEVRKQFGRIRPLGDLDVRLRGWTLDVLKIVRRLNQKTFCLRDVYAMESELARLYPGNRNVRPKIRQQLQVLRDIGLLEFSTRGHYTIIS